MDPLVVRAKAVFPGTKFTRSPLSEPWTEDEAVPTFLTKGQGCHVWDTRGREYIDYLSGFGANVLGYGDSKVEAAAAAACRDIGGPLLSGPTPISVELAEKVVTLRPGSTWAMFTKNGSDVTTLARVAARAATGKRGILRESREGHPAYHGSSPQWLGGKPGVTAEEAGLEAHFVYNDLESVRRAIEALKGDVAAIFVGGCSYPYSAPTTEPTPEFAHGLRKLADECGALIVLDEIRTNFRVGSTVIGGSWSALAPDSPPDMYCLCKALANGHPIAALLGNEAARKGASSMMATGTYWLGPGPMAAALATLSSLEEGDCAVMKHMNRLGGKLATGLEALAMERGLKCTVSGPGSMPFLTFDAEAPFKRPMSELWCKEMAANGVWVHPHHNWYLTASHAEKDIEDTLSAAKHAFDAVVASAAKSRL